MDLLRIPLPLHAIAMANPNLWPSEADDDWDLELSSQIDPVDQRQGIRDWAAQQFEAQGWTLLHEASGPASFTSTLLDPSNRIQLTLQIPRADTFSEGGETSCDDWKLWIEANSEGLVGTTAETLLRELAVNAQNPELSALARLSQPITQRALTTADMLEVTQRLQSQISRIEQKAIAEGSQLLLLLAGDGPNA